MICDLIVEMVWQKNSKIRVQWNPHSCHERETDIRYTFSQGRCVNSLVKKFKRTKGFYCHRYLVSTKGDPSFLRHRYLFFISSCVLLSTFLVLLSELYFQQSSIWLSESIRSHTNKPVFFSLAKQLINIYFELKSGLLEVMFLLAFSHVPKNSLSLRRFVLLKHLSGRSVIEFDKLIRISVKKLLTCKQTLTKMW